MVEEHEQPQLWILDLSTVEDAKDLALEISPDTTLLEGILKMDAECPNEPWICVVGRCDICSQEMVFFAPSAVYEDGIVGVKCCNCENMSIYPQERDNDN